MTSRKMLIATAIASLFCGIKGASAADNLQQVLSQLDKASANFRTTSAEFKADSAMTDPIPQTDTQTGTIYFQRKGSDFQIGMRITEANGKPVPKTIVVVGGVFKMYEKMIDQLTVSNNAGKYEGYLSLAFGASGKDLADKWNITYQGSETVDGVKTEKLSMVPKDPAVLKYIPKAIVWVDPAHGVALKQYFDQGSGQSRTCSYTNIKVNQKLPSDAFTIKTDSRTQVVNR